MTMRDDERRFRLWRKENPSEYAELVKRVREKEKINTGKLCGQCKTMTPEDQDDEPLWNGLCRTCLERGEQG